MNMIPKWALGVAVILLGLSLLLTGVECRKRTQERDIYKKQIETSTNTETVTDVKPDGSSHTVTKQTSKTTQTESGEKQKQSELSFKKKTAFIVGACINPSDGSYMGSLGYGIGRVEYHYNPQNPLISEKNVFVGVQIAL